MIRRTPQFSWITNTYLLAGLTLAMTYWLLESAMHVFIFGEGTFWAQVLTLDPHELSKRLLFSVLVVVFSLYAQHGINVRRRTEAALKTSEEKYRTLIEKALNPVFLLDQRERVQEVNEAALQFFDLELDQVPATMYRDFGLPEQEADDSDDGFRPELGKSEIDLRINGGTRSMVLNMVPLAAPEGGPVHFYGIGQDITERKSAEANLKITLDELNQIFQTASSAMRVVDSNFTVLKVNETFAQLAGLTAETAVGEKCYDIFAGDRCHTNECPLACVLGGEKEIEYELTKTRKNGSTVTCLLTARPFVDADGRPIAMVESFKDVTELTQVQEELVRERDKLRHILFQQTEGVSILRTDFAIEYLNPTLRREIGDCRGVPCYRAFRGEAAPCDPCYLHEALLTRTLQRCELEAASGRSYEHTYTPFRDTDGEEKVVVYLRDITDVRASRAAAVRSEQLAAVGELAAGVAHEINNPMNGIINYAQMLVNLKGCGAVVHEIAQRIVKEGDRVAEIVASLLSFARRGVQRQSATTVEEILSESLTLVGAQLRKDGITLEVDVPEDLPQVFCVQQEIQQVVLNVLNNARYALNKKYAEDNGGKKIEIAARAADRDGPRFVQISIRDHGIGISPETINKVMHPFFSTKPKGEGTGLGLSISHDIIDKNAGILRSRACPASTPR